MESTLHPLLTMPTSLDWRDYLAPPNMEVLGTGQVQDERLANDTGSAMDCRPTTSPWTIRERYLRFVFKRPGNGGPHCSGMLVLARGLDGHTSALQPSSSQDAANGRPAGMVA